MLMGSGGGAPPPPPPEHDAEAVGAAETLVLMANSGGDLNIHNSPTAMQITATNAAAAPPTRRRSAAARKSSYKCTECGKVFDSHQALGGHQTGHRDRVKHRVNAASDGPPVYACRRCNMEFKRGQSLGGHMRKHFERPPTHTGESSNGGAAAAAASGEEAENASSEMEICLDKVGCYFGKKI